MSERFFARCFWRQALVMPSERLRVVVTMRHFTPSKFGRTMVHYALIGGQFPFFITGRVR